MDEHALAQVLFCVLVRLPEGLEDDALDLGRGHARHRAGLVLSPLGQDAGDVVAIAGAVLDRVARGHAVAAVVEDAAEQERLGARAGAPLAAALLVELGLHGLEQRALEDRLVLAGMALGFVIDLAAVDPVAQKMGERAVAEGHAADHRARGQSAPARDDAGLPQLALQRRQRAKREVTLEDQPDRGGFLLVDDELALAHPVSERHLAARPEALAFGGRDLVADALARDLALELGEGEQHVEGQAPHAGRGVEAWVTDTKETPCASKSSTSLPKSESDRV